MKKLFFLTVLSLGGTVAFANHITGGEMYYTLTSQSGNNYTYHVVLKLYRDCFAPAGSAPLDDAAPISIFDNANNTSVWSNVVNRLKIVHLNLGSPSPCVNNPPPVCYDVGYYEFDITLPANARGYTIAYQRCCRIAGINNLLGSNNVGATYTAEIPGTTAVANGPANNSAHFVGADTVVICANNSFCYDFGASDLDSDSLAYYFCSAYNGGTSGNPAPNPPANPPYNQVPYSEPYKDFAPLGNGVQLNQHTGMMCGVAPPAGIYVVTVCVSEFRNGVLIATQRKDLQIKVGDCSLTTPQLDPGYITCDGFNLTFANHNDNPLVHTYLWTFGDASAPSNAQSPTHTYSDTGTYAIKLVVNQGEPCSDSSTSIAKVYPGFFPGFTFAGVCANKPTQFFDTTRAVYGVVNSWSWDFGDPSTSLDVSQIKNPTYSYPQNGIKTVRFIVGSSKGCIDTVFKDVAIIDKPPITVQPKDTLICNGDNVMLQAIGNGVFSWTPATNIINANTATPTVNPTVTTSYFVQLDDNGCINQDTVKVRVVDFVTLQAARDTVICAGDSVRLTAATDGLRFSWTPSATLDDPSLLSPMALPTGNTSYQITATIGGCSASDNIMVTLVPYPLAAAGPDTTICFDGSAQLHAGITGNSFTWSPAISLNDPNILNPVASPLTTSTYVLTVFDILGCPKPKRDSVVVTVLPKINAFAGRDTLVVVGQPLQFNASGGTAYFWSPSIGLNHNNVNDPIGVYDGSLDSIRYKVVVSNQSGCSDSAYVTVRVFRTNPQIFVPTAFTPNGDGKNDYFKPIAVGISKFDYFRVYNRWGQLVYSSTNTELGWDGRIGGKEQSTATFVWLVKGTDFTGKVVFAKGLVTLIR
jgi:gliding motility-associated-like protein